MREFIENFVDWGENLVKPFKTFIHDNYDNPLLMVALLGIGIGVFLYTYNALNKNNQ